MNCPCGPNKENLDPFQTAQLIQSVLRRLREGNQDADVFASAVNVALFETYNQEFQEVYRTTALRLKQCGRRCDDYYVSVILYNNGYRAFVDLFEGSGDEIHLMRDPLAN